MRARSAPETLSLSTLEGRWHVIATTFPMWRDRCDVTFSYGTRTEHSVSDVVAFTDPKGTPDTIEGVDTQHDTVPTHLTWRGRGVLSLFTSEWDVVAVAEDASWVVLAFGATLATPAGVDVIARAPTLDQQTIDAAIARAASDPLIAPRTAGLYRVSACQR